MRTDYRQKLSKKRSLWKKLREKNVEKYTFSNLPYKFKVRRSLKLVRPPYSLILPILVSPKILSIYNKKGEEVARVTAYRYPADKKGNFKVFIPTIDVKEQYRNKNLGNFLVKAVKETIGEGKGIRVKSEPQAEKFWEKLGFQAKKKQFDPFLNDYLTLMELPEEKQVPFSKKKIKKKKDN